MSVVAHDVALLAAWLEEHGLAELHLTGPDVDIHLVRPMAQSAPSAPPLVVRAPSVGLFLARHPLHGAAPTQEGRHVIAGQEVAFLRIGLLLRPVLAPAAGFIGPALVAEETAVGYGTPLFLLHPEAAESKQ